jgi:hypothetical protein
MSHVWTREILVSLFKNIERIFGPYRDWEYRNSPGRGRDRDYAIFCNMFAKIVGARSVDAVDFVVLKSVVDGLHGHGSRVRVQAAALDTGFIRLNENGMTKSVGPYHGRLASLLEEPIILQRVAFGETIATSQSGDTIVAHNRPIEEVLD